MPIFLEIEHQSTVASPATKRFARKRPVTMTGIINGRRAGRRRSAMLMGSKSSKRLSGNEHGQPEPIAPIRINLHSVRRCHGAILCPSAKGNQQHRQRQHQQCDSIQQDSKYGPAFHVTAEFSHQVQPHASKIGAWIFKNPVLAACKIIIPTPNFPKRALTTRN